MPPLTEVRFRSSPHLDLKQLGDLGAGQREAFRELERDPDFYGLLVPRPPLTMNLQSVSRPTADLFRTLSTPSYLDAALLADGLDLVLDGILEIESGDGFVSGADALPLLCPHSRPPEVRDAAALLSRKALLHAQDLETSEPRLLTMALYLYNRIPISLFWKARFADRESVLAHLGADRGPLQTLLEREWDPSGRMAGWLSWSSKSRVPRRQDEVTYKLYVSPRPERIRETFAVVARVLIDFPGTQFKIGDGAAGILRPDKLVAYFRTRGELDAAAARLHRELGGCDAHGVPFTAALDDTGLLSWGIDPPGNERVLRWLGGNSWRYWIAQRLGAALSIARFARSASAVEPWAFAIERVRRQGVDVESWTPPATLWSNS
jgi:hypothetical protein